MIKHIQYLKSYQSERIEPGYLSNGIIVQFRDLKCFGCGGGRVRIDKYTPDAATISDFYTLHQRCQHSLGSGKPAWVERILRQHVWWSSDALGLRRFH